MSREPVNKRSNNQSTVTQQAVESECWKCPVCGVVKAKGKYVHFSQHHPDLDY